MRRQVFQKSVDKSTEKKQHEAILGAINADAAFLENLSAKIAEATTALTIEEDHLTNLRVSIQTAQEQKSNIEKEIHEKSSVLSSIFASIEIQKNTLAKLQKEKENIYVSIDELQKTHTEKLKKFNQEETDALASAQAKKKILLEDIETLESRINSLQKEKEVLSLDVTSLQKLISSEQSGLSLAIKEVEKISADAESVRKEVEDLTAQKYHILAEINAVSILLHDTQNDSENARQSLQEIEKTLEEKQQKLLGLAVKEKRTEELRIKIIELYRNAGIEIVI